MICEMCEFPTEAPTICVCGKAFCSQCQRDHQCDTMLLSDGAVKPRDYQATAHGKVREEFANGSRATLVVMPTGTGKTILFAEIIRQWTGYS